MNQSHYTQLVKVVTDVDQLAKSLEGDRDPLADKVRSAAKDLKALAEAETIASLRVIEKHLRPNSTN